ncbi:type IV toxin-antitoxin system AbiEi family antitoxin domain-containing protein [Streptomyces sp. SID13031]|uniref:type IV toxin-antitoxin system AbiEi family antitoxin domain-containing protein n=1 Tax=Streptomyces sp. SID13031 TaxID=2706046 RepID=UPI0013C8E707|nr:type IV toxin-antitoxin system AbiEi family antitoxin domain-containing protein [Streptomyces sp. SID13031]NEA30088.1 type IV toxin-antitoxin system AbiEi family antitoxin domain-containing protein [Streptomyces sp. SID13031]
MNRNLATTAAERGGWFERADAHAAGYDDNDLRARVRAGRWVRLCRGAYAELREDHQSRPEWDQARWLHLRAAKAFYHRLGGRAVVSHQSAALLHGIEVTDLDLGRVHLTRLSGLGRSGTAVCQHAPRPPVLESVVLGGVRLTPAPRAVVEAILLTTYPVAVSVVDEALRRGLATPAGLVDALELFRNRTGIGPATRAVLFGDGRSESVGESRLRVLMADLGLPAPLPQAEIRDELGGLVGRVDFLLADSGVIVEFDGALKYAGTSALPLVREKQREDALRDLGYEVVRATWADLARPDGFARRIRSATRRAADRRTPMAGSVTASGK